MQKLQSEKNMAETKIGTLTKQIESLNKEVGKLQNQLTIKNDAQSKDASKYKQELFELTQKLQKSEMKVVSASHELKRVEANYQRIQDKMKSLSGDKIQYKNSYEITCKMDKGLPIKKTSNTNIS